MSIKLHNVIAVVIMLYCAKFYGEIIMHCLFFDQQAYKYQTVLFKKMKILE